MPTAALPRISEIALDSTLRLYETRYRAKLDVAEDTELLMRCFSDAQDLIQALSPPRPEDAQH